MQENNQLLDALYRAFARHEEPTDLSITMPLTDLVPLSKLMSEEVAALRKWAQGRARRATPAEHAGHSRKIMPAG